MVIVFLSFSEGRRWPHRITIYLGMSFFWVHLTGIGGSFTTLQDVLCDDHFNFDYTHWAKFQSWALDFGGLATACWWLVQGIVIFWNVTLLKGENNATKKFEPLCHVICWGYPFTVAFILNWVPSYQAGGGSPSGFPFGTGTQYAITGLVWGLYPAIYCSLIFLNLIFITTALIRIISTPLAGSNLREQFQKRLPAQLLIISFWCVIITSGSFGILFGIIFLIFKIQARRHIAKVFSSRVFTGSRQLSASKTAYGRSGSTS